MVWLAIAGAGIGGILCGYLFHEGLRRVGVSRARATADEILAEAYRAVEAMQKEAELVAKQQAYERQAQLDEEVRARRQELQRLEDRILKREDDLLRRQSHLERRERDQENLIRKYQARERMAKAEEEKLRASRSELLDRLAQVGNLRVEEARRQLMAQVAVEARYDAAQTARRVEQEMRANLEERARATLATAIERCSSEFLTDGVVEAVPLQSEDMKGRVIGKEGRNIRAFEVLTGVDLVVDDIPETILVSSFDPMRREIARRALATLIRDGRIHPSRIEQTVAAVRRDVEEAAIEEARSVAESLDILDLPEEVLEMLGRLRYRTSYGQNVLLHSREVGTIAGSLASELGESAAHARRAGLLHDIGKATQQLVEGNHVEAGLNVLRRYGEHPDVLHAIEAHHEGVEARTTLAVLLLVADRVSAARPGARRESLDNYVRRLQHLEEIACRFHGVERAFAIHAGRELRVIVEADKVTDDEAYLISKEIARKVQSEIQFKGPVQVTVIREFRATMIAHTSRERRFMRPAHHGHFMND